MECDHQIVDAPLSVAIPVSASDCQTQIRAHRTGLIVARHFRSQRTAYQQAAAVLHAGMTTHMWHRLAGMTVDTVRPAP
jgi:hypothetical protein